jgi:addiction module HigA family antidote
MVIKFDKEYLQELYKTVCQTIINKIIMSEYVCARPIHPGELLKEEVESRGLSKRQLAMQAGVPYRALGHVLTEQRPLTEQMALLLEAALGIPADLFVRMQMKYSLRVANENKTFAKRLAQVRKQTAALKITIPNTD